MANRMTGIRLRVGAGAVDPQGGGRKAERGVEPSALIVEHAERCSASCPPSLRKVSA